MKAIVTGYMLFVTSW